MFRFFLLAVVILALAAAGAPEGAGRVGAAATQQGNVNCDAGVTAVDALQVLRSVAGLSTSAACLQEAGDTNCDTNVNAVDALRILRFVAGLSNSAPAGCTAIGQTLVTEPSSIELIDAALKAGSITEEQALLYTTFSVFGDSRLPAEFAGANADVEDTLILQQLSAQFDSLSPETQAAVTPFMLPPSAPNNWMDLLTAGQGGPTSGQSLVSTAVTWQTFSAVGGKVKIWAQDGYPGDADKAQALAAAMTNTIYPSLQGLMGREPPGDDALPNNGGDGAIDIYLVHMTDRGEMKNYGNACDKGPGYILVNSQRPLGSETSAGILQTAAHEFFHLVEWTFQLGACWNPEFRWAVEGFAKWSEDWVYPLAQSEQPYASDMLDNPAVSLEDNSDKYHAYGTYLLPYYLSRKVDGDLIREVWEAFEGSADSVDAIGGVLASLGGWDQVWPEVALYDWNRQPVDDYKQLDALAVGASPEGGIQEISTGGIVLAGIVDHLGAKYYHFKFLQEAHTVEFKGNDLGSFPYLHVRALLKIGGQWKAPEDWTYVSEKRFCRDFPPQNLEELVVIVSNTGLSDDQNVDVGDPAPTIEGKNVGCTKWTGWVSHTHHGGYFLGHDVVETSLAENVVFELDPNLLDPNLPPRYWVTTGGTLNWTHTGSMSGCSGSGSGSYPIGPLVTEVGSGQLEVWDDGGERLRYHGVGTGPSLVEPIVMYQCPDGVEIPGGPLAVVAWWSLDLNEFRLQPDGSISDTVTVTYPEGDDTWQWEFHPAP